DGGIKRKPFAETLKPIKTQLGASGEPVVEALRTLKDEVDGSLDEIRTDAKGAKEAAAANEIVANRVDARAAEVERLAGEIDSNFQHIKGSVQTSEHAAATATSALTEIKEQLAGVTAKSDEGKDLTGAAALSSLSAKVERIPHIALAAVKKTLKASVEVTVEGGKVANQELSGEDLIAHVLSELKTVKRAVGGAVREAKKHAHRAEAAKEEALEAVEEVKKSLGDLSSVDGFTNLADFARKMDKVVGIFMNTFDKTDL